MATFYPWIILAGVVILIYLQVSNKKVKTISGDKLYELIKSSDKTIQFIDVRTPNEFKNKKVKPFINLPLDELPEKGSSLKKDKPIVILCATGRRSAKAFKWLTKNGYTNVVSVAGGISTYKH